MVKSKNSLGRAFRLMHLGTGLAGSYIGYQLQRSFLGEGDAVQARQAFQKKNAQRVRHELQQLRGPVMKLGQALSMQTHLLTPEVVAELSALQMQAPPMHPTLMRAQFKAALGRNPEELFRAFDEEPFAAASLGQVHRAMTRQGERVAVKIQYPAMREAIGNDFRLLRTAGFAARITGHLKDSVVCECERGILEETDYVNEAKNIEFFRKALKPLPFVRIPKVFHEFSTGQVLTMSHIPGSRLPDFIKSNPSQALRDKLGIGLTQLFFFQLFQVQALHADPHPGNYLLNDDGTIGLIDFGCVKYLKPEVVHCYAQFWSREWANDPRLLARIIRTLFGPKISPSEPRVRKCMAAIKNFYDKYHPLDTPGTLDLADTFFMEELTKLAKTLLQNKFLSPDFLFLSRSESGMCSLLHMLRPRVPTTQIALQWMPKTTEPAK